MKKKTFTVDRATWLHGGLKNTNGSYRDSMLRDDDGQMCCLGFVCNQMGVELANLQFKSSPTDLRHFRSTLAPWVNEYGDDSDLSEAAMRINDNTHTSRPVRETQLTKLFAKHGLTLKFKGQYEKS